MSVDQSVCQSVNQSVGWVVSWFVSYSVSQLDSRSGCQLLLHPVSESVSLSISQSAVSQSVI